MLKLGKDVILTSSIKQKVAMLDGTSLQNTEQVFVAAISKDLLHQRLGHIGKARLECMVKHNLVKGIIVEGGSEIPDICKHRHRDPFPKLSNNRATEVIAQIHTDVHGPLPQTVSGSKYWIVLVDDTSRLKQAILMKKKSDASEIIKTYVRTVEKQTGKKVKILHDDKGGEYMSKDRELFLNEQGIT